MHWGPDSNLSVLLIYPLYGKKNRKKKNAMKKKEKKKKSETKESVPTISIAPLKCCRPKCQIAAKIWRVRSGIIYRSLLVACCHILMERNAMRNFLCPLSGRGGKAFTG